MAEETENKLKQIQKAVIIMVKKILICGMCCMLMFGVCVSAELEMPQGNPPSGMQRPQGTPPEGMEIPDNIQGFSEGEQPQNGNQMTPPNMNFGGGNMPGGFDRNNTQADAEPMTFMGFVKEYQTPIISIVLLVLAFIFVKFYKRKNY